LIVVVGDNHVPVIYFEPALDKLLEDFGLRYSYLDILDLDYDCVIDGAF
jgi:hypothetical protein